MGGVGDHCMQEGGWGLAKEYSLYAFINVDNFERPLTVCVLLRMVFHTTAEFCMWRHLLDD